MTNVFVAGPIDFQDLSDLIEYRLEMRDAVRAAGHEPVDQYSDALDRLAGTTNPGNAIKSLLASRDDLDSEPYLKAIDTAITERSIEALLDSPEIVPEIASQETIEEIVDRDLELLRSSDGMVAYFPGPSNGTTVELLHAVENDIPAHVVSESPSMFIQRYADDIHNTTTEAVSQVSSDIATQVAP